MRGSVGDPPRSVNRARVRVLQFADERGLGRSSGERPPREPKRCAVPSGSAREHRLPDLSRDRAGPGRRRLDRRDSLAPRCFCSSASARRATSRRGDRTGGRPRSCISHLFGISDRNPRRRRRIGCTTHRAAGTSLRFPPKPWRARNGRLRNRRVRRAPPSLSRPVRTRCGAASAPPGPSLRERLRDDATRGVRGRGRLPRSVPIGGGLRPLASHATGPGLGQHRLASLFLAGALWKSHGASAEHDDLARGGGAYVRGRAQRDRTGLDRSARGMAFPRRVPCKLPARGARGLLLG